MFGDGEVKLRALTDAAGIFRRDDRDGIEDALEGFGRKFPQMFLAIYTGSLGETGNLRQFGFWLLNRGVFEDVEVERPNEAGILIVIDPESKTAGMTHGYLMDPFLEDGDSFACLSRAHAYWLEGRYAEGLLKSIRQLEKMLKKRCARAWRDPERYERRVGKPVAMEDLVKKIRSPVKGRGETKDRHEDKTEVDR